MSTKESRRFLRSTLDALSAHIAILDEHGTILEVNAAWNRFAAENRFQNGHGIGDNYLQVCDSAAGNHSPEALVVANGIRAIIAGERDEFSLEYPCHSPKTKCWFLLRATRFGGDGPVRVVVAHENITEQKRAEESVNLFRTLIDQSTDGYEVVDPATGRFLDVNGTSCARLGYTREEFLALRVPDIEAVAVKASQWDEFVAVLRKSGCRVIEGRQKRKDGSTFPVEVSVRYVKLDRDYLIAAVRDITDRKEAEKALQHSNEQLRALSARLQSVRETECERIAREIHDELGQALTALNLDLIWIQQNLAKSPRLRPQFKRRIQAATSLLENTVRSVQRISAELRPAMLDDLGLAATLEWHAEEFAARTGIRCQWQPKPVTVRVNRDHATALFRIFQEILTNVARHARASAVNLKLIQTDGELILEVADDGKGFDERKLLRHKSLGLLGMRERAAFIGGLVKVQSAPGHGTKVTVTSPAARPGGRKKLQVTGSHGKKSKNPRR